MTVFICIILFAGLSVIVAVAKRKQDEAISKMQDDTPDVIQWGEVHEAKTSWPGNENVGQMGTALDRIWAQDEELTS